MKNNKGFVGIFIIIGILIAGGATYALVPRSVLKSFFQTGDKPNQEEKKSNVDADVASEVSGNKPTSAQFKTLIDSSLNLVDDRNLNGSKEYNPTKNYQAGDTVIKSSPIYESKVVSPGQEESKPNPDQSSDTGASTSTGTSTSTSISTGTSAR